MKGIVLAGGSGSRLFPLSLATSKQLMPVFDKPMIYYPISTLMLAGIQEILIICSPIYRAAFEQLLGDGKRWGVSFTYRNQNKPNGLAEAFIIGEEFIGNESVALILGDNLFYGMGLGESLRQKVVSHSGAKVYCQEVRDPERYGIVELSTSGNVLSLEEKPTKPKSSLASTGLYFFDNKVAEFAKQLEPSKRGELEMTDLLRLYMNINELSAEVLERGVVWLDTGTIESLSSASEFVRVVQERQGIKISSPEEVAWRLGFISDTELKEIAFEADSSYHTYLRSLKN